MTLGIRAVAALVVAAVGLVISGALLGQYFETPDEATLRQPPQTVTITDPVRTEMLERSLTLRMDSAPALRSSPRFAASIEGKIVSSLRLKAGRHLASGTVALEVEGRPVIVLTGAFPTWRDFSRSMSRGRDVAQLQAALAELGLYRGKIDGKFGPITLRAMRRLYESIGYAPSSRTVFVHEELLFVPANLRTIERVDVKVGDRLLSASVMLVSDSRRFEADLSVDQASAIHAGAQLRLRTPEATPWSATIDRVITFDRADGSDGPNAAILTTKPIPESVTGEQILEVVLASTQRPVLSASPSAIDLSEDGTPFVVVLAGGEQRVIPVTVGLVTDSRVEITPIVADALRSGDEVVLNPPS